MIISSEVSHGKKICAEGSLSGLVESICEINDLAEDQTMGEQSVVNDGDGNPTHVRETSSDGSSSVLYEYDSSLAASLVNDHRGAPVEAAEHRPDGETRAYEYDNSLAASLTNDHRGTPK